MLRFSAPRNSVFGVVRVVRRRKLVPQITMDWPPRPEVALLRFPGGWAFLTDGRRIINKNVARITNRSLRIHHGDRRAGM